MMKSLLLLLLVLFQLPTTDTPRRLARKALQQELAGIPDEAEVNYKRALKREPRLYQARLNLGNNLYRQERFAEALSQYRQLSNTRSIPVLIRAKAFYNAGTTYLRTGKLRESQYALQQALTLDPADQAARYNLAYVLKLLAEQNKAALPPEKAAGGEPSAVDREEKAAQSSDTARENSPEADWHLPEQAPDQMEQTLKALDLLERKLNEKAKRNYGLAKKTEVEKDW